MHSVVVTTVPKLGVGKLKVERTDKVELNMTDSFSIAPYGERK
jgi:hypothetical protein